MSRSASLGARPASTRQHHRVVIVGGGQAGISVAARLRRAGVNDVALVEPSPLHCYQPLWTLVGGGLVEMTKTVRGQASFIPKGVTWILDSAVSVDPVQQHLTTTRGRVLSYDRLVMAPGIQLDWDATPGMPEAMRTPFASSNYDLRLAPKTWEVMRDLRGGTALFTMPAGAIKCPGAPQKIAYLCADHWRARGVLRDIQVVLAMPGGGLFGVPVFARALESAVKKYGIDVRFNTEVTEIDGDSRKVSVLDTATGVTDVISYDALHVAPEHDAIGSPLHPCRSKVSTADLEVVFPAGNAIRLAVSRGWINCKVGITAVTSLVPLGKFDINFVLCVGANVVSGSIREEPEHRCLIHVVDVALDNPLVRPKSHIVGSKQLRGSPFSLALGDLEM